ARGHPPGDPCLAATHAGSRMKADAVETGAEAELAPPNAAAAPAPSVRTVKGYSVPGEGSSTAISVVTVIALFVLWWVATHFGWIKDLFLPTPEKVLTSFAQAWSGDIQGGKPLSEHLYWSLFRVFAAFALACVTA